VSVDAHRAAGGRQPGPRIALITVSDTRDRETDRNGAWLADQAEGLGATVECREIVPDEPNRILAALDTALDSSPDVVVFNGGTGIAPRDTTVDVVAARFGRELPGFGELFRLLSFEQIGSAAMMSRACAGIIEDVPCFCLPGSHGAVRLAWERLIAPELGHMMSERRRPGGPIRSPSETD